MSRQTDDVTEGVARWEEVTSGQTTFSLLQNSVSFYRVWSIELGSHFAQVSGCLFLSITVVKINITPVLSVKC
jgi:hypothetical protein